MEQRPSSTNHTIQYVYDSLYLMTSKTYPDETAASYVYDVMGKVQQMADPSGSYSFAAASRRGFCYRWYYRNTMATFLQTHFALLVVTAVIMLLAGGATAQTGAPPNAPLSNSAEIQLHSYLANATEAMHKGELASAAELLRKALSIDPHSLVALNNLGIVLSREGKPAEAIPLYQEALKIHPNDAATKRNLALAYFKAQRYLPAWRLLEPMAAKYPTDFQVLDLAGLSLFALDRYPEAARYLERANHEQPSDLETLDMLGKAYLRMKDHEALTSVFARIMQVNPNSASAHILMATAYEEADNRPEAIKEYQAAAQADPSFPGVHSGLANLYWQAGDFQQAESESREELRRFPNDPVSNYVLGQVLLNNVPTSDSANAPLKEAEAHFRVALKVNPTYADALLGLGQTEIALERPREAVDTLRKAVQLQPNSGKAHYVLSTALNKLGQTAEAARERKIAANLPEKKRQERIKSNQSQ